MTLSPIRSDVCVVDQRSPTSRFELLECGCLGAWLGRLPPEGIPWSRGLTPTPEQTEWLRTWERNPTHATVRQATQEREAAKRRRCSGSHELPEWASVEPLVLHDRGDRCSTCRT